MTNNQAVWLTQTICIGGVLMAPSVFLSVVFFLLCVFSTLSLEEEDAPL